MRSRDGQAAADYAAVLLVVVAVLLVGAAVAVPGVGERVVAAMRTGVCLVGGDICRDADARAAGLSPCVTSSRETGSESAVTVLSMRVGEDGRWSVDVQSDGSAVVTRTDGRSLGASVGLGFGYSPIGLDVGADGNVGVVRRSASSWRFRDAAAARRFLDRALGPEPFAIDGIEPDERWQAFGASSEGTIGGSVGVEPGIKDISVEREVASAGGGASAEGLVGKRTGGGRTTWFFQKTLDDPHVYASLPTWESSAGPSREALIEYTIDAAGPRELLIRSARSGDGQTEEVTARLDLRDPGIRARVTAGPPWPPAAVRGLARLAMDRGVVERQVYTVDDRSSDFELAGKVGLAFGVEHTRVDVRSRLADAEVWIAGSGPRRREDCLIS